MTNKKQNKQKFSKNPLILLGLGGMFALLMGALWLADRQNDNSGLGSSPSESATVQIPHIHGLSFTADGKQLIVPAHIGLVIFEDNRWLMPDLPAHDYMGYIGVDDGFFSSGHPDLTTDYINPLGLVKSTDNGRTLETIAFAGETDFHVMGVGYQNHAIYVLNPAPNSKLAVGLYYSLDEGLTWESSQAKGLSAPIIQIAVHPIDPARVAVATEQGVFLSTDYANNFVLISDSSPVSSVTFNLNGESLFWGYQTLSQYNLNDATTTTISTPTLDNSDAIAYIAVNPSSNEFALATFSKDLYISKDSGKICQQIAQQGRGINL